MEPSKSTDKLKLLTTLAEKIDKECLKYVQGITITWVIIDECVVPNIVITFKD